MVDDVSAAARTGRAGRTIGLLAICCAVLGGISGAAYADTQLPGPAPSASVDPQPTSPQPSNGPTDPQTTPTASADPTQQPVPDPTTATSTAAAPAPRPSSPAAATAKRVPARHGAEVPLIAQIPAASGAGQPAEPGRGSGARPVTQLAGRALPVPARSFLSSLLIDSGLGALAVAAGGMLLLGVQRRRW